MEQVVKTGRWQAYELLTAWQWEIQQSMNPNLEDLLALAVERAHRRTTRPLTRPFHDQDQSDTGEVGHHISDPCGPVDVTDNPCHGMDLLIQPAHSVDRLLASYFMKAQAMRLRAQVPINETVLIALAPRRRGVLITLSLGRGLSDQSPLGSYGVDLLRFGETHWWIILLRPRGAPTRGEKRTAHRFCQIGRWLGLNIEEFLIIGRGRYWQRPHFTKGLTAREGPEGP